MQTDEHAMGLRRGDGGGCSRDGMFGVERSPERGAWRRVDRKRCERCIYRLRRAARHRPVRGRVGLRRGNTHDAGDVHDRHAVCGRTQRDDRRREPFQLRVGDRSAPGSNASELQHVRHRAGALARNVRQLHAEVAHHAWGAGAAHVGGALRHRERRGRRQRLVVDALHLQPRALEQRLRHRVFDARPLRDQRHRHVSGSRGAVHG